MALQFTVVRRKDMRKDATTQAFRLAVRYVVQLQDLGNFQMLAGSAGVDTEEEFSTMMFKRAKIVFGPGAKLRYIISNAKFEKQVVKTITVEEKCELEHAY